MGILLVNKLSGNMLSILSLVSLFEVSGVSSCNTSSVFVDNPSFKLSQRTCVFFCRSFCLVRSSSLWYSSSFFCKILAISWFFRWIRSCTLDRAYGDEAKRNQSFMHEVANQVPNQTADSLCVNYLLVVRHIARDYFPTEVWE